VFPGPALPRGHGVDRRVTRLRPPGYWRRLAALLLVALGWIAGAVAPAAAQALVPVPELKAPVTDLTGTLTPDQAKALEAKLRAFEQSKGSQVVVLVVPTTQPEEIEQYSIRVAEQWRIGRKGIDDGAIVVVAIDDRRVRIEVGYGLEGALPDATANRIIQLDIVPQFKRGDYYGGINTGVDRIMRVIEGEPLPLEGRLADAIDPGRFLLRALRRRDG